MKKPEFSPQICFIPKRSTATSRIALSLLAFAGFAFSAEARQGATQRALLGATSVCLEMNSAWTPSYANLVGYWKLNESAGATSIVDSSVTASTGSVVNSGTTLGGTGRMGKAASFNGSSGYISVSSNAALKPNFPFTISLWAKPSSVGTTGSLFSTDEYHNSTRRCGAVILYESTGVISATTSPCYDWFSRYTIPSVKVIPVNAWTHVAVVYTAYNAATLYINGQVATQGPHSNNSNPTTMAYSSTPGRIGGQNDNVLFAGMVDEVALWKVALTANQIKVVYDHQACGFF